MQISWTSLTLDVDYKYTGDIAHYEIMNYENETNLSTISSVHISIFSAGLSVICSF